MHSQVDNHMIFTPRTYASPVLTSSQRLAGRGLAVLPRTLSSFSSSHVQTWSCDSRESTSNNFPERLESSPPRFIQCCLPVEVVSARADHPELAQDYLSLPSDRFHKQLAPMYTSGNVSATCGTLPQARMDLVRGANVIEQSFFPSRTHPEMVSQTHVTNAMQAYIQQDKSVCRALDELSFPAAIGTSQPSHFVCPSAPRPGSSGTQTLVHGDCFYDHPSKHSTLQEIFNVQEEQQPVHSRRMLHDPQPETSKRRESFTEQSPMCSPESKILQKLRAETLEYLSSELNDLNNKTIRGLGGNSSNLVWDHPAMGQSNVLGLSAVQRGSLQTNRSRQGPGVRFSTGNGIVGGRAESQPIGTTVRHASHFVPGEKLIKKPIFVGNKRRKISETSRERLSSSLLLEPRHVLGLPPSVYRLDK